MKPFCLSAVLLLFTCTLYGQSYYKDLVTDRVTITGPDSTVSAFVKPVKAVKTRPEKYYWWYSANRITVTQGGYSGKLLNGPYTAYYPDKNLKEQGGFLAGLKEGKWSSWNENGILRETVYWESGVKDGSFSEYDEKGNLLKSGYYRNGLQDGNVTSYLGKDSTSVTYYKKGQPAVKKKIHLHPGKLVPGFLKGKGNKLKVEGSKLKVEDSKLKVQNSKLRVQS